VTEPLVVIGNGMAAARFVEELDARARGRYAVAVIGAEPHLAYNRVLLSSLLAGEVSHADIQLKDAGWWRSRGVTLVYGSGATSINRNAKTIQLDDGRAIPFSKLVFATGSTPIRLPVPGADLPGVLTFRDLADVSKISSFTSHGKRVVVIGGGLLGLEAAYGMAKQGASVTLLHLMPHLMERQLDAHAAELLKSTLESKGISVLCEADTTAIEGKDKVTAVRLKDGRRFETELVVMALGVRPNVQLAKDAGVSVNRGIVVNKRLETSTRDIFAIGECVEHRGICYGLVEPAYEQARVLAEVLAGKNSEYAGSTLSTNLKVSGVNVFSAGDFLGEGSEEIVLSDPAFGTYKRLVIRENKLIGAVLFGDTADGLWYLDLIRIGADISAFRSDLAFGRAFALREAA
jgi:nitrite reductase (NADH) large subunit